MSKINQKRVRICDANGLCSYSIPVHCLEQLTTVDDMGVALRPFIMLTIQTDARECNAIN